MNFISRVQLIRKRRRMLANSLLHKYSFDFLEESMVPAYCIVGIKNFTSALDSIIKYRKTAKINSKYKKNIRISRHYLTVNFLKIKKTNLTNETNLP